ncbi:hypothetical protein [Endozoicomonas sp. YOMI1]|uniref:hypothetical protein n=1 Tax=Endozoicomonas sp. YOMI1 TaxID=2828739 RepID=UPI0021478927|nr:hypothetical protein [Endozoicomonas sp. YOMI1]
MAYNSLFGWLGLIVVSPYAAYLCHNRLHPETRPSFWVAYWLFLGFPFTINALYGSLWWLAYWPVTFGNIWALNVVRKNKA